MGTGIAGMSAAWLLSQTHSVTVFERNSRIGGHSNTVDIGNAGIKTPVDTGFIVYNDETYPNLVALFSYLKYQPRQVTCRLPFPSIMVRLNMAVDR